MTATLKKADTSRQNKLVLSFSEKNVYVIYDSLFNIKDVSLSIWLCLKKGAILYVAHLEREKERASIKT